MEITFLGTGAAESVPSFFCRCEFCRKVRQAGGKSVRSRTSVRIGGKHQIDFSPDIFYQMMKTGLDTYDLEHLLITHTHADHFSLMGILVKECQIERNDLPLHIYMSEPALAWTMKLLEVYTPSLNEETRSRFLQRYKPVSLPPYERRMAGELAVTPVIASHPGYGAGEFAWNYVVERPNGARLLYASDTSWYIQDTWDFLQGTSMDVLIMECSYGIPLGPKAWGHLDVANFVKMLEHMRELGIVTARTNIYATHLNHSHTMLHEDLQREVFDAMPLPVTAAYDGLIVPFGDGAQGD